MHFLVGIKYRVPGIPLGDVNSVKLFNYLRPSPYSSCRKAVKVGVQKEGLVPCVERCDDAGLCSEVFLVAEEFKEGV